jgi:hypothetical protein
LIELRNSNDARSDLGLHNEDVRSSDATQRATYRLVIRGESGDLFAFMFQGRWSDSKG